MLRAVAEDVAGPGGVAAGRLDPVEEVAIVGLGELGVVEVVEVAEDPEEAPGDRRVPHPPEVGDRAADPFVGREGRVEVLGGHPDGDQLGLDPVVAHQGGEVGGVGLVAADVGVGVDDRRVADHPLDPLGEARLAGEHGGPGSMRWAGLRRRAIVDGGGEGPGVNGGGSRRRRGGRLTRGVCYNSQGRIRTVATTGPGVEDAPGHRRGIARLALRPEPGEVVAREVRARDGRNVLQIRIELGLLQLEVEGRPDGVRPHSFPTYLDYLRHRAAARDLGGRASRRSGP